MHHHCYSSRFDSLFLSIIFWFSFPIPRNVAVFYETESGRDLLSTTLASRLRMKASNKRISILLLIVPDVVDIDPFQFSRLGIFKLPRLTRVCSCSIAAALVEIFKESFDEQKWNRILGMMSRIAEWPVLREMCSGKNRQTVCIALSKNLWWGIDLRFVHISHYVFLDFCSSLLYTSAGSYLQLVLGELNIAYEEPSPVN